MPTIERTQLTIRETSPRLTPQPASRQFRDALTQSGRAILQGAVNASSFLPGGQMIAAAVRGAVLPMLDPVMQTRQAPGGAEAPTVVPAATGSNSGVSGAPASVNGLLGSNATVVGSGDTSAIGGTSGTTGTTSTTSSLGGDDMLAHEQDMSMQMLRLQEGIAEENRRYTALSNVLHARNEMSKNAIGNIR